MSTPRPDSGAPPDLTETAAAWLCERDAGFAPGRAAAFAAWRAADSRHAAALAEVEAALGLLGELPVVRAPLARRLALAPARPAPRPARRAAAWLGGMAAALALGFALWHATRVSAPVARSYAAEAAAPREIALPDGSRLSLNAGTVATVRLGAAERRVTLARGEAHFEVARDAARPFVVEAAGTSVRALGTAFNVRVGDDGVEVVVVEGRVEVTSGARLAAKTGAYRPQLGAGDMVFLASTPQAAAPPPVVERATPACLQAALTWHGRVTTFADASLAEVVARFNRRNALQLILADPVLGARRIGGTFALDDPEAFARLLAQDGDIAAERRGATELVLRRRP